MLHAICDARPDSEGTPTSRNKLALGLAVFLATALVLLGVLFACWTATSAWSFPRFLVALVFLIYVPGRALLDSTRVRPRPLEHLTLALLLGLIASGLLYWFSMAGGVPALFVVGILAATLVCLVRTRRAWRAARGGWAAVDGSHVLLAGLIVLAWVSLAFMPLHYHNLSRSGADDLAYVHNPADVALHLSIANELTHAVPPEVPFFAGRRLSYHYGMDLVAALFSRHAGLSVLDLTVRFLPTLFFTLTILASFCFARAWLRSGHAAVLVALLVVFGEDFSYLPGLLFRPASWWCITYFQIPTSLSLYWVNPMLPALALLFGGLFCLLRTIEDGGRGWLALTALHVAVVLEVKVFVTLHVLLALGGAGLVYLVCFRDSRLLKVAGATVLLVLPLAWFMWQANREGGGQALRWHHSYVPIALYQLGLINTPWASEIMGVLRGTSVTCSGVAALVLLAVPGFLAGTLGMRLLALPLLARGLFCPDATTAFRFFLTVFILIGPVVSMTCALVDASAPPEMQYNNAVWLFVQSKYVMWLFAVELLLPLARLRCPGRRLIPLAAGVCVIGLSIPSTVQFFQFTIGSRQTLLVPDRLCRNEVAVVDFLRRACPPGAVVLPHKESGLPLTALTQCRLPITSQFCLPPFVPVADIGQRRQDQDAFWKDWARGTLRAEVLERYHVGYVVADRHGATASAAARGPAAAGRLALRLRFENEAFAVFQVQAQAPPAAAAGAAAAKRLLALVPAGGATD